MSLDRNGKELGNDRGREKCFKSTKVRNKLTEAAQNALVFVFVYFSMYMFFLVNYSINNKVIFPFNLLFDVYENCMRTSF